MEDKPIKLIWDFKGPDSLKTAEHQAIHLKDFVKTDKWDISIIKSELISDIHAIAYMVVSKQQMLKIRDILKPHRGIFYEE